MSANSFSLEDSKICCLERVNPIPDNTILNLHKATASADENFNMVQMMQFFFYREENNEVGNTKKNAG